MNEQTKIQFVTSHVVVDDVINQTCPIAWYRPSRCSVGYLENTLGLDSMLKNAMQNRYWIPLFKKKIGVILLLKYLRIHKQFHRTRSGLGVKFPPPSSHQSIGIYQARHTKEVHKLQSDNESAVPCLAGKLDGVVTLSSADFDYISLRRSFPKFCKLI